MTQEEKEKREIEKELAILRTSYAMYEKTKKETVRKRKSAVDKYGNKIFSEESTQDTLELINTMQEDVKTKYLKLGGNEADLVAETKKKSKVNASERKKMLLAALKKSQIDTPQDTQEDKVDLTETVTLTNVGPQELSQDISKEFETSINEGVKDAGARNLQYDVIPLPSGGQCYTHKKGKITVSYLTAYDENIILSPNLYRDGTFLDHMLENKILESGINAEDLIPGDRDAIILWLRATGYGNDYPVKVTDNVTGDKFETVVDLSQVKFKPFTLKGNKYGYFDYILPISKDVVTFKFLTAKELKQLRDINAEEDKTIKQTRLKNLASELISLAESDDVLDNTDINTRKTIMTAINTLEKNIIDTYENTEEESFSHELTDRLIASIIGINKVTDRNYIENYVYNMNVRDASALRKYMIVNEPGLDYTVKVEKPASLGGGLMETFLSLDEFIFINVV